MTRIEARKFLENAIQSRIAIISKIPDRTSRSGAFVYRCNSEEITSAHKLLADMEAA